MAGIGLKPPVCDTMAVGHAIDVHHHISPPSFIRALKGHPLGVRPTMEWTPAKSIDDMDRAGVALSVVSITSPGVWLGDDAKARPLARECNEYGARLVGEHRGRFAMFACLPLPDVEGSLQEIEYAFDTLKVAGVGILTSFGDRWLGDPAFTPVMKELNRRKAIVYVHPDVPACCRNILPDIQFSVIEYAADTSRAIANLIFSGTTSRFRDIRFIFSHAGGTIPFIYQRLTSYAQLDKAMGLNLDLENKVPAGALHELRSFYYDTAQSAHQMAMGSLKALVGASNILFGTDFPFRTAAEHLKGLSECDFSAAELEAILTGNASRLMPHVCSLPA